MWGCRLGLTGRRHDPVALVNMAYDEGHLLTERLPLCQERLCSSDSVIIYGHDWIKGSHHPRTDWITLEIRELCTQYKFQSVPLYVILAFVENAPWRETRRRTSCAYFPCFVRKYRLMACMCPPRFRPPSEASEPSVSRASGAEVNAFVSLILILYA
jgi:hypothetical protein